ncbi:DUF2254 family protein [Terricaulis sp.]|uniref:DUF2254 family protein n=1 Tax=Terricaulis sp. TaxID=2768686 RepID=UPI003783708B
MRNVTGRRDAFRIFARQTAILAFVATIVFWALYAADYVLRPDTRGHDPISRYFDFDAGSLSDTFSSLSGVNAAVFAIVITVVSIIVQLTADRYTGVARMFLQDRTNVLVAAYYVVVCVVSVWLAGSLHGDYVPASTLVAVLSLTTGGLVLILPYFGYVFWFLEPQNIIRRIRQQAIDRASDVARQNDDAKSAAGQAQLLSATEELTDITNSSISGKDKIIASAAVDALKDLAIEYLKVKPHERPSWFLIGPEIRLNPDFVSMDQESLSDLETRRTWVEWKVMRQYLSIYNDALTTMRDINYVIAIDTRYIGEAAAKTNDVELVSLVFRFLNSYIRSALNAKDVRTTYNVLNQYRMLVEAMVVHGQPKAAVSGVKHMKYYGLVALDMNLPFVTETVAYDVATVAQIANERASPAEHEILAEFLELDRPPFVRGQERALMGVRKAQVKLAAYYIMSKQEERARSIARDMRDEPADRLKTIRHQLEAVENKDFWEIIDRGRNFEYMPADQRACLPAFFEWLEVPAPVNAGGN